MNTKNTHRSKKKKIQPRVYFAAFLILVIAVIISVIVIKSKNDDEKVTETKPETVSETVITEEESVTTTEDIVINKDTTLPLSENVSFQINSKVKKSELIREDSRKNISGEDEYLDLSKLGVFSVRIIYNGKEEIVSYKCIDTTPPVISFNSQRLYVNLGENIDLFANVKSVEDNSKEKINFEISGNYDNTKLGAYEITCLASDSRGNKASATFSVTVKNPYYEVINDVFYLVNGTYTTSNGKTLLIKDNIAYLKESPDASESYMIANKSFPLPQNYNPGFIKVASDAYTKMYNAAFNETKGSSHEIKLTKRTAFRDYNWQKSLYNNYVKSDGKAKADTYSARPGFSEHQTGYCLDMVSVSSSQNAKYKIEYDWLSNNAYKYGFILRYPEGKTNITGYIYEPWHYRYVGTELAEKLWNGGNWITMEEYFGVDSSYKY